MTASTININVIGELTANRSFYHIEIKQWKLIAKNIINTDTTLAKMVNCILSFNYFQAILKTYQVSFKKSWSPLINGLAIFEQVSLLPLHKLSTTLTIAPFSTSDITRFEPSCPAPLVTRTFIFLKFLSIPSQQKNSCCLNRLFSFFSLIASIIPVIIKTYIQTALSAIHFSWIQVISEACEENDQMTMVTIPSLME